MFNTIEAIFFIGGGVWGLLYFAGLLNYSGEKEERRREKVQKYGYLLVAASIVMILCGLGLLFWPDSTLEVFRKPIRLRTQLEMWIMTVRTKFKLSIAIWFLVGFPLGVCMIFVSEYFLIPLLLFFFGVGFYHLLLKCPNCGTQIWHAGFYRIWHSGFYSIPRNCIKYNAKLD